MDRNKAIETLNKYISCHDREGECDYICEECEFDITHNQLMDAIRTVTTLRKQTK